ncbi:MAG: hypothetical protein JSR60_15635 [Proteobacteria bacterium]|nr:hypothetical protein [Pseudomonadota bacterium]
MRALAIGFALVAASSAPALANGIQTMPGRIMSYAPSGDAGGASVPTVTRGTAMAIACNSIDSTTADVRVVMSLDNADEAPTGYTAVLATNQKLMRHGVHILVPDVPDFADHTVSVKVYVTDAKGTKACDAGRVHIG